MATIKKIKRKTSNGTFEDIYFEIDAKNVSVEIENDDGTIVIQNLQSILTNMQNGLVQWNEGLEETS